MGNIRVTVNDIYSIVTKDDYYPFGLQMPGRSYNIALNSSIYKYAGKELDQENGLDWYYFGARYYDPQIGRFLSVDPLAGKYPSYSPYNYVLNNPLIFIDPDGAAVGSFQVEGRIAAPIAGWLGGTGSAATGVMYDGKNFAWFSQASLGGANGAGFAAGVAGGMLSNNSVYDTEGWGFTGGIFAGAFTGYNLGGELNTTIGDGFSLTGGGGTYSKGIAVGGAAYEEGTYTWLHQVGTMNDVVNAMVSYLNDNGITLKSLGITKDQLTEYIKNMVNQTNQENEKEEKEEEEDEENKGNK